MTNTLTKLNFYLGSQKENVKSFLNLLNSGKFKPMVAYHLDKVRFTTPKQIVTIHKDPTLNEKLKSNQFIKKTKNKLNKKEFTAEAEPILFVLSEVTDVLVGISHAMGYNRSVNSFYQFTKSILMEFGSNVPDWSVVIDSDNPIAEDFLLQFRINKESDKLRLVVVDVINGKLIQVTKANVNQLIKLVNKEINDFGEETKNTADKEADTKKTKNSKEDEKKRESLEAPVYLNFKEANKTSRYNIEKIIGTNKLSGLKRTTMDFRLNMTGNMQDMIDALQADEDVNVRIHRVTSKLIDTFKDRYTEYTVTVSHKVGYDKPYKLRIKVPVPNDSGYFRIGGNDYVLLSQLFSKPILKIKPNTVNLMTNFGLLTVNLKSTKIEKKFDYKDAIDKMVVLMDLKKKPLEKPKEVAEDLITAGQVTSELNARRIRHVVLGLLDGSEIEDVIEFDTKKGEIILFKEKRLRLNPTGVETEFHDIVKEYPYSELSAIILTEFDLEMQKRIKKHLISSSDGAFRNWINIRVIGIGGYSFSSILAVRYGLKAVLDAVKVKYTLTEHKDKFAYKTEIVGDKYLNLYANTINEKTIVNSIVKHNFKKFPLKTLEDKTPFEKVIIDKYNTTKLKNLKIALEKFIDKNTRRYLVEAQGTKPDLLHIVCENMVYTLLNEPVQKVNDMNNFRIRQSEIIPQLLYKNMAMAIGKFKNSKMFDKKIDIDPDYVTKELQASGMLAYTKGTNPIEELSFATRVTKSGAGAVKADMIMIEDRVSNNTYFGNISYTNTPEYSNIGVIQQTTLGLSIKNKFGDIQVKKPDNKMNPIEFVSTAEANVPFIERVNPNRAILAVQQQAQVVTPSAGGDRRLVQTGIEHVMSQMVSGRFIRRSPVKGRVKEVNDKVIVLEDRYGNERVVSVMDLLSRTKRGVYIPLQIKPIVKVGQTVQKGEVIASHVSFKGTEYAPNKICWVALSDHFGSNFEDGWAVSEKFLKKFETHNMNKMDIEVPKDVDIILNKLEEGRKVKAGETIFEFEANRGDIIDMFSTEDTSENNVTGNGLLIKGNRFIYRSTGGVIKKIVVRVPSKTNLHPEVKKLYKESTKHLRMLEKTANKYSMMDLDKSDMLSNIDDMDTLVAKPFKFKNREFEGQAVITVYTETPMKIGKGDKFTLSISGGKGTVTKIIPADEVAYTVETKQEVEMFPLTLGAFKRKNMNILITGYANKVVWGLNKTCKELLERNGSKAIKKVERLTTQVFNILDKDDLMLDGIKSFFKQDDGTILKAYRKSNSMNNVVFPLINPPFKNKISMNDLEKCAELIGIPLDEKIEFRKEGFVTEEPVSTFPLEIQMLEHFSDFQGASRGFLSTKRSSLTGSGVSGSTAGKSAQKIGTYTLDSLLVHQPMAFIKEIQIFKSDSPKATKWLQKQVIKSVAKKDELPSIDDYKVDKKDIRGLNLIKTLWATLGVEFET